MVPLSEPRLLVLHGLRLKGFGEAVDVAAIVSVDADEADEQLEKALADGLVVRRDGVPLSGWSLTAEGRAEQERLLVAELAAIGGEAAVGRAYDAFVALNPGLLELCTAWQMLDDTTINDHGDAKYDGAVIDRLRAHHAQAEPILTELEGVLERYAGYHPRFAAAIERVGAGDGDWFAKPIIDSYHTVWFQLHEDLLNTLGVERAQELAG
ncbi:MAG: transcriptional regulator [Acidimicrobiales bacterium]